MLQETQSIQDDDELLLNLVISEIQSDPDPGNIESFINQITVSIFNRLYYPHR